MRKYLMIKVVIKLMTVFYSIDNKNSNVINDFLIASLKSEITF